MNDPVTDIVEAGVSTWFKKFELIAIGVISIGLVLFGMYAQRVLDRSKITVQAVQALKDQQGADKKQFDHSVENGKKAAAEDKKNDNFNKEVEANAIKTPLPNCYLPADRVRYINAAASRK